ncbi:DNA mismatch repair protein Msh2 isoform X2 [Onthophagus taurus]|uniref:DNA mismatch repair protein Msh2 isoform X2 n=1 Tax=Onthophagus taurus TaxID=166361 RepID=UPI0039BEA1EF
MTNVEPLQALNMDPSQQQGFVRFYRNLPENISATVRFFNHSDYYTVHEDDAKLASETIFGNKIIKYMGLEPKLSYLVLSRGNFEKFIKELLLVKQYRVEVYTKPSTQSRQNTWSLEYKGSPGNLSQFEDILFDNSGNTVFNSTIMCIKNIKANNLGVACINTTESTFFLTEFIDNEFHTQLDALIAQIGPKECIIPQGDSPELVSLKKILDRCNILVVRLKKNEFSGDEIDQDLNRLLFFNEGQQRNYMALPSADLKHALGSLQAGIKYLNLTGDENNFNQYKISTADIHRYVRLDTAALNALNLFPKPSTSARSKSDSIFDVLDNCSTAQGRRLLEQWIKQPLRDINIINERLEVVEALVKNAEARSILSSGCLTRVPDVLVLAKKLSNKKATLQDCYKIYQVIESIPGMLSILKNVDNKFINGMLINPITDVYNDLEKYQAMIEQTLDFNLIDRGEFFIKPSYDEDLTELNEKKLEVEEKIQKVFKKASNDLGLDMDKVLKLECNDQHGYYFRITLKEESALRNNKSYRIIDAIKGGVRFTNDRLSDLNETYQNNNQLYEKQQKHVVDEILTVASGYADSIRNLNLLTAQVDVLVSFATAATSAPITYTKPKLFPEGTGILKLFKARHPCLEKQDDCCYIPNDIDLKQDEKILSIITGPNMGGKSTFMRSIGTCVLLAHIGSLVPCESAEISLVDCILARVGAEDCELKGLSTFMLEMVETSGIVRSATKNSLVIIDELGRGTSTYDGCGIAWAIAEHLARDIQSFTLFATHYHEITQLSETIPTVFNLHASAVVTKTTITPLYQIKEGSCDKSYGIHCARMAEFPVDVIQNAIEHQKKLEFAEGMKYINDYEPILKRNVINEGDKLLKEVLDQIKSKAANLNDEELMNELKRIKEEVMGKNLFIKGLLE